METADGRTLDAQLLGRDPATDLAVLRVGGLRLDPARPAEGPGRVGQLALAVGRPGGRELMASLGVVSAVGGPTGRGAARSRSISRRTRRRTRCPFRFSTICWAVHAAVGASVTLEWTTRLRWCARTTKTNNTLNVTVGTVKKSTETRLRMWLSRNVRQVCDGGFRWRTTYLDTVAWEISMPSFRSSP